MNRYLNKLLCLFAALLIITSCKKSESGVRPYTYKIYTPEYKSKSAVLQSINGNPAEPVANAGKIYIKDAFIFLNEVNKGIHIIDNTNPSHPSQIAFLSIPGNLDIAVKGNILYADMYADLLAIDISNPKNVTVQKLVPGFFQERSYVYGNLIPADQVPVNWKVRDTTVFQRMYNPGGICANCMATDVLASSSTKSTGTAGSMAAMVLMNDRLYAITERHSLGIVDITNAKDPEIVRTIFAGFDLQTIFPFKDKLFLGSAIGMFMYDLSNPDEPVALGQFSHGRACDPVIAEGDYAYVTLHGGTECGGADNELHVIDIKDLANPTLLKTYPLTKPTGLCKDNDLLFVCDGSSGVRIFDASDENNLKQIQKINRADPYDIIAFNHLAMVVTAEGIFQYDYSDPKSPRELSFFSLRK